MVDRELAALILRLAVPELLQTNVLDALDFLFDARGQLSQGACRGLFVQSFCALKIQKCFVNGDRLNIRCEA